MQARWKTTTGCVIAAVVAVALFFAIHGKPDPPRATLAKSPEVSVPPPRDPTDLAPVTPPPGTAPKEIKLEVCGADGQPHTVTATDSSDASQYVLEMKPETYDNWKSALIGGPDVRGHAMGLLLQRLDDFFSGTLAADTSLEQLVELATMAHDPVVYGIAVGVCQTGTTADVAPACRRLSLSEWTKLDPDNAIPWLATAAAARANGDSWAESVAFARAAQAQKVDNYDQSSLAAALAALPANTPRPERLSGQIRLLGYNVAWARPDISEISRYCSASALQQAQIHDQCDAVAGLLVDHGGTLLNFSMGSAIGRRVGWPTARVEEMTRELDTLRALGSANGGQGILSCDSMAWNDEFLKRRSQIGELAALRELQAKSTTASSQ